MSIFVQVIPDLFKGKVTILPDEMDKKVIRSQAMKSFRQKQRRHRNFLDQPVISADEAWRSHRKRHRRAKETEAKPFRQDASSTLLYIRTGSKVSTTPDQDDDATDSTGFSLSATCIAHMVQKMRMYIDALTDNFIDGYFARARTSRSLASIMVHWARPTSPTFETGNNSLALLHFGAAIGDQRITKQGQRLYLDTLNMVRIDIRKGAGGSRTFESMFASAQDLLNCEIYSAVSCGFDGWAAHLAGIDAIIKIPGFKTMNSVFAAFMTLQFRHVATMYALVTRSTVLVPDDCYTKDAAPTNPGSIEDLTRLALAVVKCLEYADALEASASSSPTFMRELYDLGTSVGEWVESFRQIHLGRCDTMKENTAHVNRHFIYLGLAFQKCLLLLIYEARWRLSAEDQTIQNAADDCAKELWDLVPHLAETTAGEVGKAWAVRAPLYFVGRWYRQSQNGQALEEWTDLDMHFRHAFPYLDWGALLPFSFLALLWIG